MIIPMTSVKRALAIPRFKAKYPKLAPLLSLKMPAQAAYPVLPKEAPSVLHLIQPAKGGVQITSIILVGFGQCMLTLNRFRITKSDEVEPLAREVKLLAKEVGKMIIEMEELKLGMLLLNLTEFLQCQIVLNIKIIATVMTT
jgi:hypothetical protein